MVSLAKTKITSADKPRQKQDGAKRKENSEHREGGEWASRRNKSRSVHIERQGDEAPWNKQDVRVRKYSARRSKLS